MSKSLGSAFSPRVLVVAFALALVATTSLLLLPSEVGADVYICGDEIYYYSSPSHSMLVGYEGRDYGCNYNSWGTFTQWYVYVSGCPTC